MDLPDILIWLAFALLAAATLAVVASKLISLRKNRSPRRVNGIPAKLITWLATGGTVFLLLLTYLALPADDLLVNGIKYESPHWLRLANSCIATSLTLLTVAILSILLGLTQNRRSK